jgi:hypothetical protein
MRRHSSKNGLTLITKAVVDEGIFGKMQGHESEKKMQQCLGTNARHSFKNALTLNPKTTVEESIEIRAFLEPYIKEGLSF